MSLNGAETVVVKSSIKANMDACTHPPLEVTFVFIKLTTPFALVTYPAIIALLIAAHFLHLSGRKTASPRPEGLR